MSKTISYSKAQKKLIVQWFIFSGAVFIIFLIQTLTGKYEGHNSEVWEWVFQFITPPLTLMIGVLINQLSATPSDKEVDIFYYRIALGFSIFFLVLLLISSILVPLMHYNQNSTILITTITEENKKTIMDAFGSYNAFLIPISGLTTLTLGLFFTKSE